MTVRGLMRCKNRYKTAEAAEAALQELVDRARAVGCARLKRQGQRPC